MRLQTTQAIQSLWKLRDHPQVRNGSACPSLRDGGVCSVGFRANPSHKHPAAQAGLIRLNGCPWEGDWHEAEAFCPAYPK